MIEKLFERVRLPDREHKIEVFTDGNSDYTSVLPPYYAEPHRNYGQLVKLEQRKRTSRGSGEAGDLR
jgi:hypothetical protein